MKIFRFIKYKKYYRFEYKFKGVLRVSEQTSKEVGKKIKERGKVIIIAGLLLIIILLGIIVFWLLKENNNEKNITNDAISRGVVVNPDNVEELVEQMKEEPEPVPVGTYEVTMNSTWNFADWSSASDNAYVENSTANTNDVYFDVMRSDTSEIIYSSPVLPVGTHLDSITLDKVLSAGSYDCIITYNILDDAGNSQSTVKLALIVVVEQ